MDLPAKAAFIAPGHAAGADMAVYAVLELHQRGHHVVIVDGLAGALVLRVLPFPCTMAMSPTTRLMVDPVR